MTIERIDVFGSILREKDKIPDIDVYLTGSKSEKQKKRRQVIVSALKDRNNSSSKRILKILREERMGKKRPINKLVDENEDLQTALTEIDYPLEWFKCLTWTYIITWARRATFRAGLNPEYETIMRKLLVGNFKGFKDFYINYPLVAKNLVLAWSPENPNVKENIDHRSKSEQLEYLQKELDALIIDTDQFSKKIKESLNEGSKNVLAAERPKVERTGGETKEELIQKIEIVRIYLKKLKYKWPEIHL